MKHINEVEDSGSKEEEPVSVVNRDRKRLMSIPQPIKSVSVTVNV